MPTFEYRSQFPVPVEELYGWHTRPGAFERLAPPWERMEIVQRTQGIKDGERLIFNLVKGPVKICWEALHYNTAENKQFVDEQVRGPFQKWIHTHKFESVENSVSELMDSVEYQPPLGGFGDSLFGDNIREKLNAMFRFRHERLKNDLKQHKKFQVDHPLKIAVTGASGMVGSQLCAYLQTAGREVYRLVRRKPKTEYEIYWNPSEGEIKTEKLDGVDVVIHLAGESILGLWSDAKKKRIRNSRVKGTKLLCDTLSQLQNPPKTLISASAIGYYGGRGKEELTEESEPGKGFLADVCQEWEAMTEEAKQAGIRVVNLRIGVVITALGGVLGTMRTPFSLGLGGPLGSGQMQFSWIALDDLLGLIEHLMHNEGMSGPINAVSPNSVTNQELTKILGKVLNRPTFFKVPEQVINTTLGDMGKEMLLVSAKVIPTQALEGGYTYLFPNLEELVKFELGKFQDIKE